MRVVLRMRFLYFRSLLNPTNICLKEKTPHPDDMVGTKGQNVANCDNMYKVDGPLCYDNGSIIVKWMDGLKWSEIVSINL